VILKKSIACQLYKALCLRCVYSVSVSVKIVELSWDADLFLDYLASTSSDTSVVSSDTSLPVVTISDAMTETDDTASAPAAAEPGTSTVTVNEDTSGTS